MDMRFDKGRDSQPAFAVQNVIALLIIVRLGKDLADNAVFDLYLPQPLTVRHPDIFNGTQKGFWHARPHGFRKTVERMQ